MTVTVDDLREAADRLRDALAVYDRYVDGWPYERESVPDEVEAYLVESERVAGTSAEAGAALATEIEELYHRAREAEAAYVQRARERDRTDWSRVVAETEPVREAAARVHAAGYGTDPETGEAGYLLPEAQCPAHRVSMNGGSSPVVYEDRVAQYRAVAERFGLSPEVVSHPGSGHDVSLSRAFPDSRVVSVDVDAAAMADLRRAGHEAVAADATGYELPGGADVVVFRNAGLVEEAIVERNLRAGGWVLANDHLESASHLSELASLDLVGVVPEEWPGDAPPVETVDTDSRSRVRQGSPLDLSVFRADA